MKRYQLKYINNLYDFIDNNKLLITEVDFERSHQLKNCKAWVIPCKVLEKKTTYNGFLLQSYDTLVGLKYKGMLFTWKKYSKVTNIQLYWFDRYYTGSVIDK